MKLKALTLFTACMLATGSAYAQQDNWPTQPVKLVVGYAPGGPVDTTARVFAKYLSAELNQAVVVENRAGASGMIAAESTSRATPDGYTWNFVASPTMTITPLIQRAHTIDYDKDFSYAGLLVNYTNVLVINKDIPVNNIQELIDYAKKNPSAVTFGSAGVGASNHLSAELLKQKTGTEMLHVPYRGNSPAMVDVIGGKITFMFDITSTAIPFIESGQARALAVTSRERNAGLPDVPSMIEAGVEDYEVTGWYGVIGPANVPESIITRVHSAMEKIAKDESFVKQMDAAGYTIAISDGEALKNRAKNEYAMWDEVIKQAKILENQ